LLLSFQIEGICAWIGVPYLPAQYFRGFGGRWELLNYLTVGLELSSWGRLSSGGLLRGRRILCCCELSRPAAALAGGRGLGSSNYGHAGQKSSAHVRD